MAIKKSSHKHCQPGPNCLSRDRHHDPQCRGRSSKLLSQLGGQGCTCLPACGMQYQPCSLDVGCQTLKGTCQGLAGCAVHGPRPDVFGNHADGIVYQVPKNRHGALCIPCSCWDRGRCVPSSCLDTAPHATSRLTSCCRHVSHRVRALARWRGRGHLTPATPAVQAALHGLQLLDPPLALGELLAERVNRLPPVAVARRWCGQWPCLHLCASLLAGNGIANRLPL
mmetsp:Transcript_87583/g.248251  ORF Transcript_87583/g.248251 Transcript_87583/m.248251 type:complete len:225 (-) Transcript_87583:188-862(-)